jgi:hypothetical protein
MPTVVRATKLPWIVALVAPALSCSLIVQFHDEPGGARGDGGGGSSGGDVGTGGDDATMDGSPQMDGGPDTVVDVEAGATVDNWNPCLGKTNGWRCGDNGLDDLLPDADLVYCSGGNIGSLTVCDAGCLHVVDPFPDSCNPCAGQANGDYCGRDLAGFNSSNADILIGCTGGQTGLQDACVHGCGSNGNMSSCYP